MQLSVNNDDLLFRVREAGGITQDIYYADCIDVDTWYHARVVGDGSKYYLFLNGILVDSENISENIVDYTGDFYIGRFSSYYFSGWIDEFRVNDTAVGTTTFYPPSSQYPNISSGTDPVETTSPYQEEDLPKIKFFQSFDTMYLFHPDYAWRKLTRTDHDTWTLSIVDHTNGPWLDAVTGPNISTNGTTGNITMTAASAYFVSTMEDSLLRLQDSGDDSWGYVKITAVTTSTSATATVVETLGATQVYDVHQEAAWSDYRGWPSSGCFVEESLVCFANDNQPQTIWASQKGDYENFEIGTEDDDAYIYTIPASNRILWPGTLSDLAIGTGDGIYRMSGGIEDYISPTNVRVRPQLKIGAADITPVQLSNVVLYWQKGARKLRELTYDPNSISENFVAPDLTLLAEHITVGGIRYSDWQQEPYNILWTVRADGYMPTMTYMRAENVIGWALQVTDGVVESVAVIPDPTDTFNEVWISVLREEGDGTQRRFVEYFTEDVYVDSAVVYSGSNPGGSTQTLSGLDHLEGKEVAIVGDGVVYSTETVSSGEITIAPPAAEIVVGLPFTMSVVTIKPSINSNGQTTMSIPKKWAEVWARVKDTSDLTINDEIIDFRTLGDVDVGEEIPLYSGDIHISQMGWDTGEITLASSDPLPCTILTVFGNLEIGDD
jgi:hypothetical protein